MCLKRIQARQIAEQPRKRHVDGTVLESGLLESFENLGGVRIRFLIGFMSSRWVEELVRFQATKTVKYH